MEEYYDEDISGGVGITAREVVDQVICILWQVVRGAVTSVEEQG